MSVSTISCDEVNRVMEEKKEVILLDVRTEGEYSKGHLPGALHIPVDELSERIQSLSLEKDKQIICYCLSSSRSDIAQQILTGFGYTAVSSMKNGLLEWRAKKYKMV